MIDILIILVDWELVYPFKLIQNKYKLFDDGRMLKNILVTLG